MKKLRWSSTPGRDKYTHSKDVYLGKKSILFIYRGTNRPPTMKRKPKTVQIFTSLIVAEVLSIKQFIILSIVPSGLYYFYI